MRLPPSATAPFPMIVGIPRSGTTLLRLMLDAHPQLAIPPETGFLLDPAITRGASDPVRIGTRIINFPVDAPAWQDFGIDSRFFLESLDALPEGAILSDVLRHFYQLYAAQHGKSRGGDKTPGYLLHMRSVASLLPEAHFIHIIRDGRDVALSWRKTWFAPSRDVSELVRRWSEMLMSARAQVSGLNYLEIRYESLLLQPEMTLRNICSFIELDFCPDMLMYYRRSAMRLQEHRARHGRDGKLLISHEDRLHQQRRTTTPPDPERIGVWKKAMSAEEIAACDRHSGELLRSLSSDSGA